MVVNLDDGELEAAATATWFGSTEALTQARLAELTGVDVMTTSQVLRTLEAAELVQRDSHPGDPRAKTIGVTPRGRDLTRKAVVIVEATDEAFFVPVAAHRRDVVRLLTELAAASADALPVAPRRAAGRGKARVGGFRSDP
jgi:DNA-binding MarR family transcriptional regulator